MAEPAAPQMTPQPGGITPQQIQILVSLARQGMNQSSNMPANQAMASWQAIAAAEGLLQVSRNATPPPEGEEKPAEEDTGKKKTGAKKAATRRR